MQDAFAHFPDYALYFKLVLVSGAKPGSLMFVNRSRNGSAILAKTGSNYRNTQPSPKNVVSFTINISMCWKGRTFFVYDILSNIVELTTRTEYVMMFVMNEHSVDTKRPPALLRHVSTC